MSCAINSSSIHVASTSKQTSSDSAGVNEKAVLRSIIGEEVGEGVAMGAVQGSTSGHMLLYSLHYLLDPRFCLLMSNDLIFLVVVFFKT